MEAHKTIDLSSTAMIFNDLINANILDQHGEVDPRVAASGLIPACVRWVRLLRRLELPIVWIRVGRRSDRKDRVDLITDASLAATAPARPPVAKGTIASENFRDLPEAPEDHVIFKPRLSAFVGTDLDLYLRARRIKTVLLGGISTGRGVESTARTAFDLDYNVIVLSDCCFQPDPELHSFALMKTLPHFSRVMTSGEAAKLLADGKETDARIA